MRRGIERGVRSCTGMVSRSRDRGRHGHAVRLTAVVPGRCRSPGQQPWATGRVVIEDTLPAGGAVLGPSPATFDGLCLQRRLGEGGMGEVWLAEQREPVRRRVALKVIKAGMDTQAGRRPLRVRAPGAGAHGPSGDRHGVRRREHRRGPALLRHGVRGRPSRSPSYCDEHRLSTARAAGALLPRCATGVQHAHQKAIIHRDLKPSNILVVDVDGRPQPKVIDFGIAKAIGPAAHREDAAHRGGALHRHTRVHEPGAGGRAAARTSTPAPTSTRSGSCSTSC